MVNKGFSTSNRLFNILTFYFDPCKETDNESQCERSNIDRVNPQNFREKKQPMNRVHFQTRKMSLL